MEEQPLPQKLIKYYECNEFSCDALLNSYLWAAYPLQFNDPFDCSEKFWNLDSFSKEDMLKIMDTSTHYIFEKAASNEERRKKFVELMAPGIICLNKPNKEISDILWGYYTNQKGFAIELSADCLVKEWNVLPIHVDYIPEIRLYKKFELQNFRSDYKKWASLKKCIWDKEEEWRFIFTDCNSYNPIFKKGEKWVRQKKYNDSAISRVILGYKFFNDQITSNRKHKISENTFKYEFKASDNKYKWDILVYLLNNKFDLYQVHLSEDLQFLDVKIRIEKIEKNEVTISNYYDDGYV